MRASDRFFKRAFAPVEVTVEARDNDPLRGPKWGKSAAITVIPPIVGEPEALRYEALARARDAFVDLLAFRIENEIGRRPARTAARARPARDRGNRTQPSPSSRRALDGPTAGSRFRAATRIARRRADPQAAGDARARGEADERDTHAANRKLTEDFTLVLDGFLRRLDAADSVSVAKRSPTSPTTRPRARPRRGAPRRRSRGSRASSRAHGVLDGGGASAHRGSARSVATSARSWPTT